MTVGKAPGLAWNTTLTSSHVRSLVFNRTVHRGSRNELRWLRRWPELVLGGTVAKVDKGEKIKGHWVQQVLGTWHHYKDLHPSSASVSNNCLSPVWLKVHLAPKACWFIIFFFLKILLEALLGDANVNNYRHWQWLWAFSPDRDRPTENARVWLASGEPVLTCTQQPSAIETWMIYRALSSNLLYL